jgi:outer membrane protein assembly factor BamE (lipoprotein component of BamABCDE complex)
MKIIVLTCVILFLAPSAFPQEKESKWTDPQNWAKIQKWMSPQQVTNILGNPLYKDVKPQAGIWYYQAVPQIEGTKITRPDYGLVRFRRVTRGGYVVLDWKVPDWDKLQKAVLKAEQQPALPTQEELEAAQKEIERLAEEKQKAEERAKQAELERQRALQKQNNAKKFDWLERKNLLIGGGILLAIVGIYTVVSKAFYG